MLMAHGVSAGASINSYFLGGYTTSQVQPPGRITVSDLRAAKADGDIVGAFSMALPAGTDPSAFNFLYVFGPLSPTGELMQHEVGLLCVCAQSENIIKMRLLVLPCLDVVEWNKIKIAPAVASK